MPPFVVFDLTCMLVHAYAPDLLRFGEVTLVLFQHIAQLLPFPCGLNLNVLTGTYTRRFCDLGGK
jgi:hypothetical protein